MAHFHVNWLSPIKVRKVLIGGSDKMIVYDDMENVEKVKIYDSGIDLEANDKDSIYSSLVQYRTGDMYAPKLDNIEALKEECQHFVDCIKNNEQPISNGEFGLSIVKILTAAQQSIKENGKNISLDI